MLFKELKGFFCIGIIHRVSIRIEKFNIKRLALPERKINYLNYFVVTAAYRGDTLSSEGKNQDTFSGI